jgi:hypothetical protein
MSRTTLQVASLHRFLRQLKLSRMAEPASHDLRLYMRTASKPVTTQNDENTAIGSNKLGLERKISTTNRANNETQMTSDILLNERLSFRDLKILYLINRE